MPPPRKRHPRSLDALFPRPKKPPIKRCPKGHRQTQKWIRGTACRACLAEQEARERAAAMAQTGAAEREEWSRRNKVGPVLMMRVVDTGRLIVHKIPRHLAAQKRAMDKRRGPRRKRRI